MSPATRIDLKPFAVYTVELANYKSSALNLFDKTILEGTK
jgi:hypothetical protein